jgi:hypothetical protein
MENKTMIGDENAVTETPAPEPTIPVAAIELAMATYRQQFNDGQAALKQSEQEFEQAQTAFGQRKEQLTHLLHQLHGAITALDVLTKPAPTE